MYGVRTRPYHKVAAADADDSTDPREKFAPARPPIRWDGDCGTSESNNVNRYGSDADQTPRNFDIRQNAGTFDENDDCVVSVWGASERDNDIQCTNEAAQTPKSFDLEWNASSFDEEDDRMMSDGDVPTTESGASTLGIPTRSHAHRQSSARNFAQGEEHSTGSDLVAALKRGRNASDFTEHNSNFSWSVKSLARSYNHDDGGGVSSQILRSGSPNCDDVEAACDDDGSPNSEDGSQNSENVEADGVDDGSPNCEDGDDNGEGSRRVMTQPSANHSAVFENESTRGASEQDHSASLEHGYPESPLLSKSSTTSPLSDADFDVDHEYTSRDFDLDVEDANHDFDLDVDDANRDVDVEDANHDVDIGAEARGVTPPSSPTSVLDVDLRLRGEDARASSARQEDQHVMLEPKGEHDKEPSIAPKVVSQGSSGWSWGAMRRRLRTKRAPHWSADEDPTFVERVKHLKVLREGCITLLDTAEELRQAYTRLKEASDAVQASCNVISANERMVTLDEDKARRHKVSKKGKGAKSSNAQLLSSKNSCFGRACKTSGDFVADVASNAVESFDAVYCETLFEPLRGMLEKQCRDAQNAKDEFRFAKTRYFRKAQDLENIQRKSNPDPDALVAAKAVHTTARKQLDHTRAVLEQCIDDLDAYKDDVLSKSILRVKGAYLAHANRPQPGSVMTLCNWRYR